ncbi:MAG: hypothetical protein P1V51_25260 [Deltaproteobacteria bacterium]|nr:hypothetical protein [Deltaproteobacteria bacterium]
MIELLRHEQRQHLHHEQHDVWHSLFPGCFSDPSGTGFGFLLAFDELLLRPGASTEFRCGSDTEVVAYVYEGALSQKDSRGSSGVLHAGGFQRTSTGFRLRQSITDVSRHQGVHLFRMIFRSAQAELEPNHEQRCFTEAQRRNLLCAVASPDERRDSLRIHQDALVYSAVLDSGLHIVHELAPDRTAWLHTVSGQATLDDITLTRGDSVSVTDERAVSFTAREDAEFLLIDMGPTFLRPWEK